MVIVACLSINLLFVSLSSPHLTLSFSASTLTSLPWERSFPQAPSPSEGGEIEPSDLGNLHRSPYRSLHRRRSSRLVAMRMRHLRWRKRCHCCCDCCFGRLVNQWPSPWVGQSWRNELQRTSQITGRVWLLGCLIGVL